MFSKFKVSDFYRHVGILLSGSTLAQIIPLLSELVLVRLFTPAQFGVLALFLSISTLFSAVATARYDLAIILPKTEQEAVNVLGLCLFITLCVVTPLSALVVWIFPHSIAHFMDSEAITPFLPWVPLFVAVSGIYAAFFQWNTRRKHFKTMAFARISQSGTNALTSIGTGLLNWQALGLIIGQIAGWTGGGLQLFVKFWKHDRQLLARISKPWMQRQAKKYIQFPTINSMHVLSDIGQQSLSSILIARYFSEATLGFYSRMIRIVKVPMGFIGTSVGQVFYQEASQRWHVQKEVHQLYLKNLKLMFLLGSPIFSIVALWGPDIFAFVLTEPWRIAGEYARWLSLGLFSNFVISPFSTLPLIANKQLPFFLLSLIANTAIVISFVISYYVMNKDMITALMMISLTQFVFNSLLGLWFYQLCLKKL